VSEETIEPKEALLDWLKQEFRLEREGKPNQLKEPKDSFLRERGLVHRTFTFDVLRVGGKFPEDAA
jgi:hypothetical protein